MTIKSNADPRFDLWAGDVQSYIAVQEAKVRMDEASIEARASSWGNDDDEDEGQFDGYDYMVQQIGSTAVISIQGQLIPQSNWLTRLFGMTGYDEIKNSLVSVINEGSSKSMLLDINSPGGATEGLEDVASSIKQVNDEFMPVVAHSAGTMASAAYWLGSAAGEVYATKMATVGSIGVVAVHQEISKMLTDQGITTTVLRKGKYKMLGNPLEKLSALAIKVIDDQLAFMYEVFTSSNVLKTLIILLTEVPLTSNQWVPKPCYERNL
jgi:ClpP class serine protease